MLAARDLAFEMGTRTRVAHLGAAADEQRQVTITRASYLAARRSAERSITDTRPASKYSARASRLRLENTVARPPQTDALGIVINHAEGPRSTTQPAEHSGASGSSSGCASPDQKCPSGRTARIA